MRSFPSSSDPFILYDTQNSSRLNTNGNQNTTGLTPRSFTINPVLKTLVLFVGGQSNWQNILPSYTNPVNSAYIDNLNIYDGNLYNITGPLLGTSYVPFNAHGPGNTALLIADALITNGKFSRVILVPMAIGSTTMSMWGDVNGIHSNRLPVAIARLAARGITASTQGVTFACIFGIGETDFGNGTTQAAYTASANNFLSTSVNAGMTGRFFIPLETAASQTSNPIRLAQASLWNGVNVFSLGDFDTIPTTQRQDGTHLNNVGALAFTNIAITQMAASGAPF